MQKCNYGSEHLVRIWIAYCVQIKKGQSNNSIYINRHKSDFLLEVLKSLSRASYLCRPRISVNLKQVSFRNSSLLPVDPGHIDLSLTFSISSSNNHNALQSAPPLVSYSYNIRKAILYLLSNGPRDQWVDLTVCARKLPFSSRPRQRRFFPRIYTVAYFFQLAQKGKLIPSIDIARPIRRCFQIYAPEFSCFIGEIEICSIGRSNLSGSLLWYGHHKVFNW